jgi:sterol desaturase/sphingolipid hydroxylase (fatty acid hydroxylase superfamily)
MIYQVYLLTFIMSSILCYYIDIYYTYFRVNEITREQINKNYKKMIPYVATNIIITYPFTIFFENYVKNNNNTYPFLINFILWIVGTDILFYIVHRTFHTKYLYFLHSRHHEFNYTHGIGAIYASIPDYLLANILPISVPILVFSIPYLHIIRIIIFAVVYTVCISHGGFKISKGHLRHHLTYKCNYGLLIMDRILNTKFYLNK